MGGLLSRGMKIDNIVLNAGVLKYPNVSIFASVHLEPTEVES